jgi:hypothetical protein
MRSRLNDWLQGEPIPRELHGRVMGDPRLATRGGGGFSSRLALVTAALVLVVVGGGLGSILLRGTHPTGGVANVPSSPSPSASKEASPSAAPSDSPASAPSQPVVVPSPQPSPTPSPTIVACPTSDLTLTLGSNQGAAGTIYQVVDARNHSTKPCSMQGYFGMSLQDSSGHMVGSTPVRDNTGTNTSPPPKLFVVLQPGDTASFTFHWSDVQSSPQPCPTASQVELTAPNQFDHAIISARTSNGITIAPCSPGQVGLGPVVAGA